MKIDDLDYELPESAIATRPAHPRDHSRLMVYHRSTGAIEHRHFFDLPNYLNPGDLLIVNDSKVVPAKLMLRKETGASIPGLFLREIAVGTWQVMLRSRGKLRVGMQLTAESTGDNAGDSASATAVTFTIKQRGKEKGHWIADISPALPARDILERIGHVPLPPYIERERALKRQRDGNAINQGVKDNGVDEQADKVSYQTVYANSEQAGSVAAPTAGLHFTPELLQRLHARGIERAQVTLHVGLGTFLPVEAPTLAAHPMHTEEYAVPAETIYAIRKARSAPPGRRNRIIIVGTTATRTLETAAQQILETANPLAELRGQTNLLIQPGYAFQLTDVLITNFHLPRSTLLALVGALVGIDKLKHLYREAIKEGYRFYSYGDAMLILE